MATESEKIEAKIEIFRRVAPGDRWDEIGTDGPIHESLTDALEQYFQKTGIRQYYIDAAAGFIYRVEEQDAPETPLKNYSIYGDYQL